MPSTRDNFYSVLTDAVNDLLEHGFDSEERVAKWLRELEAAISATMSPFATIDEIQRRLLRDVYQKMVERHGVMKYHPGIQRWTIDKLKPHLRLELDKRILASANLIRLNREQSIAQTLRRFSGWATSIPEGGTAKGERAKVKERIKKPLQSLPFEERRVAIDQGHKLLASINTIVAEDQGAIAAIWHSHWRQANYNYRPDHKERDEKVYLIRNSWAQKLGYVKPGPAGYTDQITQPGEEVYCRCFMQYIYSLRELPSDMLTIKGRETLERTRIRADAADDLDVDDLFVRARTFDRMDYSRGIKGIRVVPDRNQWHAQYDPDTKEIVLQDKFFREPNQVQILLHEIGHRGQDVDKAGYEAFKRAGLNEISSFVATANPVHLQDYERKGEVDGGIAAEVWAESYARAMLELPLPDELEAFWHDRINERDAA